MTLTTQVSKQSLSRTLGPVVAVRDGQAVASSLDVARFFHKAHKTVLASIDLIRSTPADRQSFLPIGYVDGRGRQQRAFDITPAGFSKLVLGFRGSKAEAFRDAYIREFQRMEAALKAAPSPAVSAVPQTMPEALRLAADALERAEAAEKVVQRISDASGLIGQRDAAKVLNVKVSVIGGLIVQRFGWGFRGGDGKLKARAEAQHRGLLQERAGVTDDGKAWVSTYLTPKALKILAEHLCSPLSDQQIQAIAND